MSLKVATTGIRGVWQQDLDVPQVRGYSRAFFEWSQQSTSGPILIARDGRASGEAIAEYIHAEASNVGVDICNGGQIPTPTAAVAVDYRDVVGAIMITASHNPPEYNGLKFLNAEGELLPSDAMSWITDAYEPVERKDTRTLSSSVSGQLLSDHIERIQQLKYVQPDAVANANIRVVVDGINSVGGPALMQLSKALGVSMASVRCINCDFADDFVHKPEPRESAASQLQQAVLENDADIGLLVDPDGDRVAFVDENGDYVTEELTQVIVADWVWQHDPGSFVTNLSASQVIDDVAAQYNQQVYRTSVGERHVVTGIKENDAIAGGEGTGSPIIPALHCGRDALLAAAVTLSYMAAEDTTLSSIVNQYPGYEMCKDSVDIDELDVATCLEKLTSEYSDNLASQLDGVKIRLEDAWVHVRPSSTEPIMRIFAEAPTYKRAKLLTEEFVQSIELMQ